MTSPKKSRGNRSATVAKRRSIAVGFVAGVTAVALATVVCWVWLDHRLPDVVMVYLLAVVVVAMRFGYPASLTAAALGVAAFDFFFTRPYFSLAVEDTRALFTFAIMLFVAVVISTLTAQVRRAAALASEREHRTATLYAMSRELSTATSQHEIARIAQRHVAAIFSTQASLLLPADGKLVAVEVADAARELPAGALDVAQSILEGRSAAPVGGAAGPARFEVLRGSSGALGVLVIGAPPESDPVFEPSDLDLLRAVVDQTALAIERARLAEDEQRSQLEIQRERLRSALLSSVSHDLRTPLAVMKGTVTALIQSHDEMPRARRLEYLETLSDEASHLNLLVDNLLNVTSLEAGALRVRKEWQPLEETIGVALNRLEGDLQGRAIEIAIQPEASLVPFDARLIEQVFINLVENAAKYTPAGSPIEIRANAIEAGVDIQVADRGPGVPAGREERIFEKFERAAQSPSGMGLGLTICRGIVTVHGGRIWCEPRPGGGSAFHFVLPRPDEAPQPSALPDVFADA
ncbi:MAG TPA: DUF4118 domain-containing protein [Polyangiaceae bacterium]|nr:DUF4118 domain-containing protein [Polyangiaceae bacterium]